MEQLVITLGVFGIVLLAVSWIAERWNLSAPLLLLGVGLIGSYLPFFPSPELEPELVLVVILPPLLYSAAVNTPVADFRKHLTAIASLSVGLVLATMVAVGLVAWQLLGVPPPAAFALGAVVAPPDAVAATAVARRVGLPRRIVTILEGESLVNDATALVSLRTALLALTTAVTVPAVLGSFAWAVLSAVVIGYVVARVAGVLFKRLDSPQLATTLSFLVPFAAYLPVESLHGSGVLAVVVCGLVLGHRSQVEQSALERLSAGINWATVSFVLENAVFLLLGLQTQAIVTEAFAGEVGPWRTVVATVAIGATVIGLRLLWNLGTWLTRGRREGVDPRFHVVAGWAGMRGVVTLAAALSLPATVPQRATLIFVALAVTVGTLVLHGTTLGWVASRLGVRGPDPREDAVTEALILQRSTEAGLRAARDAASDDDADTLATLEADLERRVNGAWERLGRPNSEVEPPSYAIRRLRLTAIEGQRAEVLKIRDEGSTDQAVVAGVLRLLDLEEAMLGTVHDKAQEIRADAFTAAGHARTCRHLEDAPLGRRPASQECLECRTEGTTPVHLRECLTCGHVGCCDSSVGRHATRHFHETGHPVMRSFEPGESWRWCYVDRLLLEADSSAVHPPEETVTEAEAAGVPGERSDRDAQVQGSGVGDERAEQAAD